MFNPFMVDGTNFPYCNSGMFHQYGYGNMYPNYYYVNKNYTAYTQSNKPSAYKDTTNCMNEISYLKQECQALFNINRPCKQSNIQVSHTEVTIEAVKTTCKPVVMLLNEHTTDKNNKNSVKNESKPLIISLIIKISSNVTKTLEITSSEEAYSQTKSFCNENALNTKMFYSIFSRINTALKTLYQLPEKNDHLREMFSCTNRVFSKLKRSHSIDSSEHMKKYNI